MKNNEKQAPTNLQERQILIITCFGHFLSHFNTLVFPAVLLPLAHQMNMEMEIVLGFSFWMYLLFGIMSLPWGIAADRWGARPFLILFYVGAGICGFASAAWIYSPIGLTLSLAGIGFFSAIYHPVGLGWISKDIKRVSIAMAYNGIFGNVGLAAAPLVAGFVNWLWGLKAVFIVLGGLNFSGLIMMLFFSASDSDRVADVQTGSGDESIRSFMILLVAMMLGGIIYSGSTVILPAYFELKNEGLFRWIASFTGTSLSENLVATTVTSIIYIIGMVGQYAGGLTAERFDLRWSYLVFHSIVIPAALLMSIMVDIPLIMIAMIYFFFLLGMQPIENTLVARFTPKKFHHAAYGTKFILTFGVGSLAVKMIKVIKVNFGIEAVFPALSLFSIALVGTVIVLILNTSRMRS